MFQYLYSLFPFLLNNTNILYMNGSSGNIKIWTAYGLDKKLRIVNMPLSEHLSVIELYRGRVVLDTDIMSVDLTLKISPGIYLVSINKTTIKVVVK